MTWRDTSRSQCGAITARQLEAHGLSKNDVRHLVKRGELERYQRGAYLVGGAEVTYAAELWLAVLRTRGRLAFATAGHLWGVVAQPAVIDVAIPAGRRIHGPLPGIRLHRTFIPRSACTAVRGLPVTSRTWTLIDLIATLPPARAQQLADRALQRSWLTRQDIARRIDEYPYRGGNPRLGQVLAVTGDRAAAESERIMHRLLKRAGVRDWIANYELRLDGILVAVVDVAIVARRVAIEVDGWAYHSDAERFVHDRRRQNALVLAGWSVLRFSWADLTQRPESVVATLRRVAG